MLASKELGFTERALALITFVEPLHYTVTMELFVTCLATFLRQLP